MEMHSPFDLLIKETLPAIASSLVSHLLNRKVVEIETLEHELALVVSKRYCDFVFRAVLDDGTVAVVHIEVWLKDKSEIPRRMLEYLIALHQTHGFFPAQFVLFIEEGAENYRDPVPLRNVVGATCALVPVRAWNLSDLPIGELSDLQTPRDLILSLFMNRGQMTDAELQQKFAANVNKFSEEELIFLLAAADYAQRKRLIRPELSEWLVQKVMETVTNVNFLDHLLTIPIVKDSVEANLREKLEKSKKEGIEIGIKDGVKKGVKKGRKQGLKKGIEIGKDDERRKFIRILHKRGTSPDEIAQMLEIPLSYVQSVLASENGTH
jgi:predicted transposase YdaD